MKGNYSFNKLHSTRCAGVSNLERQNQENFIIENYFSSSHLLFTDLGNNLRDVVGFINFLASNLFL